jgi:hypothetical protein
MPHEEPAMHAFAIPMIAAISLLAACQPAAAPDATAAAPAAAAPAASADATPASPSGADFSVGTHTFTGTLNRFEDAGYPMFVLEVGPADAPAGDPRNLSILFNDEGGGGVTTVEAIQALSGKPVEATYEVTASVRMLDVSENGTSMLVPEPEFPRPAPAPTDKSITGVLSGIQETEGDLPTELTVTAADGTVVTFEHFVGGSGLENANGKTVTLRYEPDISVNLVALKAAP